MNKKEALAFLRDHVIVKVVKDNSDFFDEDDHMPKDCPQCNFNNGPMGTLGKTLQFCCRACGWWYT